MKTEESHDFNPLFKVPMSTWAAIVAVIVSLVGTGISSRSNAQAIETKADKSVEELHYQALSKQLDSLQADVREIRAIQKSDPNSLIQSDLQQRGRVYVTNDPSVIERTDAWRSKSAEWRRAHGDPNAK